MNTTLKTLRSHHAGVNPWQLNSHIQDAATHRGEFVVSSTYSTIGLVFFFLIHEHLMHRKQN